MTVDEAQPMWAMTIGDEFGVEHLRQVERPRPQPGPNEVLIRVQAVSLNYRDWEVINGRYHEVFPHGLVPMSDGAGEIVACGAEVTVLLKGETGTGKELAAREIHDASKNSAGPFVTVNCAAIPSDLFESELFGYADGAFTGSRIGGRSGLLESANNGTFFLDEVNAMPLAQQAKLLRVLQEKEIRPVGSKRSITLNVKFVAACNIDLYEQVKLGLFREDLYHRLNVFVVVMPSLRERLDDLPALIDYFSHRLCGQYELDIDCDEFRAALLSDFVHFGWPGNVRQLENMLERLLVSYTLYNNIAAFQKALPRIAPEIYATTADKPARDGGHLQQVEHDEILRALERFGGNKTQAAEYLGMSQTTLWRRLKSLTK